MWWMVTIAYHKKQAVMKRLFTTAGGGGNSSGNELHRLLTGGILTDLKTLDKDFKQFQSQTIRSSLLPHSLRQIKALNGEMVPVVERKTPLALFYAPNQQSAILLQEWQRASPVPFLQVNVNEGPFQKWLEFIYAYSLRKSIPTEQQSRFAIWSGDFSAERAFLGIENRSIPHIYLVDRVGRLRWRACGVCTEKDKQAIKHVGDKLITEKPEKQAATKRHGRVNVV